MIEFALASVDFAGQIIQLDPAGETLGQVLSVNFIALIDFLNDVTNGKHNITYDTLTAHSVLGPEYANAT